MNYSLKIKKSLRFSASYPLFDFKYDNEEQMPLDLQDDDILLEDQEKIRLLMEFDQICENNSLEKILCVSNNKVHRVGSNYSSLLGHTNLETSSYLCLALNSSQVFKLPF
jgi:hypothetical protein